MEMQHKYAVGDKVRLVPASDMGDRLRGWGLWASKIVTVRRTCFRDTCQRVDGMYVSVSKLGGYSRNPSSSDWLPSAQRKTRKMTRNGWNAGTVRNCIIARIAS